MSRSASSRANRRGEPPPSPEPLPSPAPDSHTHLDIVLGERPAGDEHGEWASDDDVDAEIAAAVAVNVPRLVQVGVDVPSSRWSAALAARHPNVLAAVALHPNEAGAGKATDDALAEIDRLAAMPRVRAVGETGLDRYRTGPGGWAAQEASFRAHIRIAKDRGVALVIHDREAHEEILDVLDDEGAPEHTVLHCFSGDAAFAKACVARGFVLSFAGTVTFGNASYLREAAALTPVGQMLVETDAPFLTPMPYRGRPNASRLVPHTVRALAEVTGVELAELCQGVTATAERVFGVWGGDLLAHWLSSSPTRKKGDTDLVGRLIAVVLFIAVLVPGVLLARAWWLAAGRRAVAAGAVDFAEPTAEGAATLRRQAQHGRRVRQLSLLLAVAGVIGSVILLAEASVFLWGPILAVGLLFGVLLAEATRPRPRWKLATPPRRPRRGELISAWLVWIMRGVVVAEVAATMALWRTDELATPAAWAALVAPVAAWVLAEIALLRAVVRPLPAEGADVPVDEALRTWTAHLVTAATSVLALLPLGALLLIAGIDPDRVTEGFDLLPVALVAGGFSALAAGLAVAVFLLTWLRPIRSKARALAG